MLPLTRKEARNLKFTGALAAIVLVTLTILSPTIKRLGESVAEDQTALLGSVVYLIVIALWVITVEYEERNFLYSPSALREVYFGTLMLVLILMFWGYAVPQMANAFKFPWTTVSGANGFLILIITGLLYLPQLIRATWQERLTNSTS
jgi:hypothetical protein